MQNQKRCFQYVDSPTAVWHMIAI